MTDVMICSNVLIDISLVVETAIFWGGSYDSIQFDFFCKLDDLPNSRRSLGRKTPLTSFVDTCFPSFSRARIS